MGGASITILLCSDGSYYTGVTRRSVEERVSEHAQGLMPGYTFTRRPVKLVFSEHYERIVGRDRGGEADQGLVEGEEEGLHARGFLNARGACEEGSKAGRVAALPNRRRALERPFASLRAGSSRLLLRKSASR